MAIPITISYPNPTMLPNGEAEQYIQREDHFAELDRQAQARNDNHAPLVSLQDQFLNKNQHQQKSTDVSLLYDSNDFYAHVSEVVDYAAPSRPSAESGDNNGPKHKKQNHGMNLML